MPRVEFGQLPDMARTWVFGSTRELSADEEARLLAAVDEYLEGWKAHGLPLSSGRDWKHRRLLAIAVDQRDAHASGCSIDGLYRVLRGLESELNTGLLGGGVIFYRDRSGKIAIMGRDEFSAASERGEVTGDTRVFDLTIESVGEWMHGLEKPARVSWHNRLLIAPQRA